MKQEELSKVDSGVITASLAVPGEQYDLERLIAAINDNIHPPSPVMKEDVYIRAMYIVSDAINAFGGKFPADEHGRLAELLVDAPVLVGHRKDQLPVGRNFHAIVEERNGRNWVKSYFYWLRSADGAQSLCDNIDGGIYKECSIGFQYGFAECSQCGSDMRGCGHSVSHDGSVWFNYREIQRVLETSLVYRGAMPETAISKELTTDGPGQSGMPTGVSLSWNPRELRDTCQLNPKQEYVAVPACDPIPVTVHRNGAKVDVKRLSGEKLFSLDVNGDTNAALESMQTCHAFMVGMRGKERCRAAETERFIRMKKGKVTRLELRLLPVNEASPLVVPQTLGRVTIHSTRSHQSSGVDILNSCRHLMTRDGVFVWEAGQNPFEGIVFQVAPSLLASVPPPVSDQSNAAHGSVLEIADNGHTIRFAIPKDFMREIMADRKVVVNEYSSQMCHLSRTEIVSANLQSVVGTGATCRIAGIAGEVHIRPIVVGGQRRFLMHRSKRGVSFTSEKRAR